MLYHSIWQHRYQKVVSVLWSSQSQISSPVTTGSSSGMAGTWPGWLREGNSAAAGCDSRAHPSPCRLPAEALSWAGTSCASSMPSVKDSRKQACQMQARDVWGSKRSSQRDKRQDFWTKDKIRRFAIVPSDFCSKPNCATVHRVSLCWEGHSTTTIYLQQLL